MASTNITTFPGKVGISNANPTHTLAIGSNVYVDDTADIKLTVLGGINTTGTLSGDGAGLSNIQSSNVIGLSSNISKIDDLTNDLSDNSSRITTVANDLSDNSSRITALETGDMNITGKKTFTEQVTFESNIRVQGDLLVANTVNMTVSDPILELGSNNLNTGDLGIVMTRHGASNSNVAVFYDESADILKMGYTLGGASDTTIELDSNALAVSIQGTLEVDTANVNTMNVSAIEGLQTLSFSSDSTTVPPLQLTASSLNDGVGALRIDSIEPDIFLNDTDGGFSTVTFANNGVYRAAFGRNNGDDFYITVRDPATNGGNWRNTTLVVDSSSGNVSMAYGLTVGSNVGIGTDAPDYELDVTGNIHFTGGLYQDGAPFVSSLWTDGTDSLYYRSNVEVGTGNLFVDTTTSNVGIGTTTPAYSLDVVGDINLSGDFYQGGSPFVSSLWTSSGTDLYYNSGSVGISNAAPDHDLSVGSNLYVDDVGSNVLVVDGNISVSNTITTQRLTLNNVSISTTMNLQQVTDVGNVTSNTVQFTNPTTAFVTTGNVEVGTANLFVDTTTGNVGIGTTDPATALEVHSTTGTQLTLKSNSRYSTIFGVDDTGSCFFGNDGGDFRITTGGDTSGTGASEALRIDSSGYIKQTLMPRFLAYYPDDNNYTDLTAGNIIIMSTTAFNVGSGYDTSTGYFTAPVDGYYSFHFGIYCSTNANRRIDLKFKETSSSTAVTYNVHQHVAGNASGGFENSITGYGYVGYSNMANFSFITKMVAGNQLAPASTTDLRTYKYRSHISGHMISAA